MKCMCAQTRPQFILSSERVLGGMEFEPMLTPREKSHLPENFPRGESNPRSCGQRVQTLPTSYSGPQNNSDSIIRIRIIIAVRDFFTFSSLRRKPSPTRKLKWPRHNRLKITCNTSSAYHVQQVVCHIHSFQIISLVSAQLWRCICGFVFFGLNPIYPAQITESVEVTVFRIFFVLFQGVSIL